MPHITAGQGKKRQNTATSSHRHGGDTQIRRSNNNLFVRQLSYFRNYTLPSSVSTPCWYKKHKGVFIATQLNSTELNWPSWTAYSQVSRVFVYDVTTYKLSQLLFTLWTCRQLDVELSSVELCRYKHPLMLPSMIKQAFIKVVAKLAK